MGTINTTGNVGEAVRAAFEVERRRRSGLSHPKYYEDAPEAPEVEAPEVEEVVEAEATPDDAEIEAHLEKVEENIQAVIKEVVSQSEETSSQDEEAEADEVLEDDPSEEDPAPAEDTEVEAAEALPEPPSKVTGSLEEWQTYALSIGYTEDEIKDLGRNALRDLPAK